MTNDEIRIAVEANPGKLGWLLGPSSWKNPRPHMPYALDNDAFIAWTKGTSWNEAAWLKMLDRIPNAMPPLWALVPDVVANRGATLEKWGKYLSIVKERGIAPAFAVQDGMIISDVPKEAAVVFIGGTTSWKWRTLTVWCKNFQRVHVGRVRITKLPICESHGVESVDGTGFFRETYRGKPARQLASFVQGFRDTTMQLL